MFRYLFAFLAFWLASVSVNAEAEWVRIGENNRSIAFADTEPRQTDNSVIVWVLYNYKGIQESRSGRRYLSEKAQYEIDCTAERSRVLFFTWHSKRMGDGIVVYTGRRATKWEPTSSPRSYGNALWKFYCGKE